MNLSPLFESHWIIVVHALTAILAILLGGLQFCMKKGTPVHRWLGRLWVSIMFVVAVSSFGIHEIRMLGPFSVIHFLSLLVLYSLWEAISRVRNGDVPGHKKTMTRLYGLALILTGAFTLLPGRVFYRVIFGT